MTDLIVERSGPVVTFIRTRSAARNAMNPEGAVALTEALLAFEADETASVGVIWGAGGAFCAGFDLKHAAAAPGGTPLAATSTFPRATTTGREGRWGRRAFPCPSRSSPRSPARPCGGMEIALWCDLRVMEEDAYMGVFCRAGACR